MIMIFVNLTFFIGEKPPLKIFPGISEIFLRIFCHTDIYFKIKFSYIFTYINDSKAFYSNQSTLVN